MLFKVVAAVNTSAMDTDPVEELDVGVVEELDESDMLLE